MSREDDVWHLLGEKGGWVTELVMLSSAIRSKLVVLTGGTLVLMKYLPWKLDVVFEDENASDAHWSAVLVSRPEAACMTKASTCSVRAWALAKSCSSTLQRGRNRSQSQNCSLHTRESSMGCPAVSPNSGCLLFVLVGRHCREEASSLTFQPIEFKSSRLPCFPPPHFLLFRVFCVLPV